MKRELDGKLQSHLEWPNQAIAMHACMQVSLETLY